MADGGSDTPGLARPELVRVLESAARLQEVVPDAVLVGGSAAALWANHRSSYDHDHVLQDLSVPFRRGPGGDRSDGRMGDQPGDPGKDNPG
jgi:hypothetical protein